MKLIKIQDSKQNVDCGNGNNMFIKSKTKIDDYFWLFMSD